MEQGHHHQFLMWTKRKYSMSSSNNILSASPTKPSSNSYDDSSWEEQAFAEDASGPLGGCIWPPRSYTCSFCRREFRSAQALGGHMNVHRRDRARLKQPSSPQDHELQIQNQNPPPFLGFLYPYDNSVTSANPNSVLVASSPSNNKALTPTPSSIFNSSSVVLPPQGHQVASSNNYSSLYSSSSSKSDWSKAHEAHGNITKVLDCGCEHNGKADVAFSLNLVVCRGRHHSSVEFEAKEEAKEEEQEQEQEQQEEEQEEEEEEEGEGGGGEANIGCKKRRINNKKDHSSILPFFPNSNSSVEFSPSSMEELDLELRLGHSKHKVQ